MNSNKSLLVLRLQVRTVPKLNYTPGNPVKRQPAKSSRQREKKETRIRDSYSYDVQASDESGINLQSWSVILHNSKPNIFLCVTQTKSEGPQPLSACTCCQPPSVPALPKFHLGDIFSPFPPSLARSLHRCLSSLFEFHTL